MRILITSNYYSLNTYVKDIVDGLISKDIEVVTEAGNFWSSNLGFDIIHLQWPEELFFWKAIDQNDLERYRQRILYWKSKGARIVATLHNELPHKFRNDNNYRELYNITYGKLVDTVINLGHYSTQLFPLQNNVIIPHANYNKHINCIVQTNNNELIFLSPGSVRTIDEEQKMIDAFLSANIKNAKLIILQSLINNNPFRIQKKPFAWLIHNIKKQYYKSKSISFYSNRLSQNAMDEFANKASVFVISRSTNLNSGIVFLGFSYGKLLIGPAIGNIKEYLEINDNLMYNPNDLNTFSNCFVEASSKLAVGKQNKKISDQDFDRGVIVQKHIDLYKNI